MIFFLRDFAYTSDIRWVWCHDPCLLFHICRASATEVNGHMVEAVESPSTPKLGMLAWRLLLHSPEFPEGRSVVLIANDVTHQAGWVPAGWVFESWGCQN